MPLFAVANAELDGEVDADADEQHRKINRDDVESADGQHAERGGDSETGDQIDSQRSNQPPGMQREPENDQHRKHSDHAVADCVLLDRAKLLVIDCRQPRQPNPRLTIGCDRTRRLTDRGLGGERGLERGVIEHRTDFDKAAPLARRGFVSGCQDPPRETGGFVGQHVFQGVGRHVERAREIVDLEATRLHAEQCVFQARHQAAQTPVDGEVVNDWLAFDQTGGNLLERVERQKKQRVLTEERQRTRAADRLVAVLVLRELGLEFRRSEHRELWRRRVNHGLEQVEPVKRALERQFVLPPFDV